MFRPGLLPLQGLLPLVQDLDGSDDLRRGRVDDVDGAVGAENQSLALRAAGQRAEGVACAQVDQVQLAGLGVDEGDPGGAFQLGVGVLLVVAQDDRGKVRTGLVSDAPVLVGLSILLILPSL